jgi:hypothetical protein
MHLSLLPADLPTTVHPNRSAYSNYSTLGHHRVHEKSFVDAKAPQEGKNKHPEAGNGGDGSHKKRKQG